MQDDPKERVTTQVSSWYDVTAYGATGTGTTDDTTACQLAINACIANGGGNVYFPAGKYLISSALTVNTSMELVPVYMTGAAMSGGNNATSDGGSVILMGQTVSTSAATYGIYAYGGGSDSGSVFRMADITMTCAAGNTAPTATFDAVRTDGMVNVSFERFQVLRYHEEEVDEVGTTTNSGLHIIGALEGVIQDCQIECQVSAIWNDCSSGLVIRDCILSSANGNGYGSIRMDSAAGSGSSASLQVYNTVTLRGDWGLWADGDFIFISDFQVNNPNVGGIYLGGGSQVWLDYVWLSVEAGADGLYGLLCDTGFQGWLYMNNSVIQHPGQHGAWLKGGSGYNFYGNSFGGCGHAAANTYDDLHIADTVTNVSVTNCHFDTDKYNTLASPVARSAIYVEEGATGISITGNQFASSGYGTSALRDAGRLSLLTGNSGLVPPWWTITTDPGWSTVPGYAPLRVRNLPEGNMQLDGMLQHSGLTATTAINSKNPLPSEYRPAYTAFFPGDINRAPVQIDPTGVMYAIGTTARGDNYAEVHGIIPLD